MKKITIILLAFIIVGTAVFLYFTRPVEGPVGSIESEVAQNQLPAKNMEKRYRISGNDSKVTFSIYELLNKKPFTVIGQTNQIAGDIRISEDSSKAPRITLGTLKIDARTFKTDSEKRDGAINRMILKTTVAGNEYITFTPKNVTGVPDVISNGTPFTFVVEGDLTISGITKPVSFAVNTIKTDKDLTATVKTTIQRSDFNLSIPSIPFVADVPDAFEVLVHIVAQSVV